MPPFQRKTLVLIGAQGVGRRSLKNRLIVLNPLRYGITVPCECIINITIKRIVHLQSMVPIDFHTVGWGALCKSMGTNWRQITPLILLIVTLIIITFVILPIKSLTHQNFMFLSHFSASTRWRKGRSVILLCVPGGNGDGHQGKSLPWAWRIWRQSIWNQNRLHPWSRSHWTDLHTGRQPTGEWFC